MEKELAPRKEEGKGLQETNDSWENDERTNQGSGIATKITKASRKIGKRNTQGWLCPLVTLFPSGEGEGQVGKGNSRVTEVFGWEETRNIPRPISKFHSLQERKEGRYLRGVKQYAREPGGRENGNDQSRNWADLVLRRRGEATREITRHKEIRDKSKGEGSERVHET